MYTVRYKVSPPFLHAQVSGEIDIESVLSIDVEINEKCVENDIRMALIDVRDIKSRITTREQLDAVRTAGNRMPTLVAVAYVGSDTNADISAFLKNNVTDDSVSIIFFTSISTAVTWLIGHYIQNGGSLSSEVLYSSLAEYPSHVVILDQQGNVRYVNKAWKRYSAINGGEPGQDWTKFNYLKVCDTPAKQGDKDAIIVSEGLSAVLANTSPHFEHSYPCSSPNYNAWYKLLAFPAKTEDELLFIVSHEDITLQRAFTDNTKPDSNGNGQWQPLCIKLPSEELF